MFKLEVSPGDISMYMRLIGFNQCYESHQDLLCFLKAQTTKYIYLGWNPLEFHGLCLVIDKGIIFIHSSVIR